MTYHVTVLSPDSSGLAVRAGYAGQMVKETRNRLWGKPPLLSGFLPATLCNLMGDSGNLHATLVKGCANATVEFSGNREPTPLSATPTEIKHKAGPACAAALATMVLNEDRTNPFRYQGAECRDAEVRLEIIGRESAGTSVGELAKLIANDIVEKDKRPKIAEQIKKLEGDGLKDILQKYNVTGRSKEEESRAALVDAIASTELLQLQGQYVTDKPSDLLKIAQDRNISVSEELTEHRVPVAPGRYSFAEPVDVLLEIRRNGTISAPSTPLTVHVNDEMLLGTNIVECRLLVKNVYSLRVDGGKPEFLSQRVTVFTAIRSESSPPPSAGRRGTF